MTNKIFCLVFVVGAMYSFSCANNKAPEPIAQKEHWLEIKRSDGAILYVDPLENKNIIQSVDSSKGGTVFKSFLIGFKKEKIANDEKQYQAYEKYFQYEMDKDWRGLISSDSFPPVFYEPKVKVSKQVDEGVLVFEVPNAKQIDTLVFQDSYGSWGTQKIALY